MKPEDKYMESLRDLFAPCCTKDGAVRDILLVGAEGRSQVQPDGDLVITEIFPSDIDYLSKAIADVCQSEGTVSSDFNVQVINPFRQLGSQDFKKSNIPGDLAVFCFIDERDAFQHGRRIPAPGWDAAAVRSGARYLSTVAYPKGEIGPIDFPSFQIVSEERFKDSSLLTSTLLERRPI